MNVVIRRAGHGGRPLVVSTRNSEWPDARDSWRLRRALVETLAESHLGHSRQVAEHQAAARQGPGERTEPRGRWRASAWTPHCIDERFRP